ncbi:hypothetical protein JI747_003310 [Chryseobacterium sp. RG1]|uniref:GLPGLI family protein n=1 Tax=Chryseobacterium tagetis TaxID=2801334 RepID=A0ABS7ZX85_9FLAO|nr:hypothetical protein [Chryseobacterium tagetis]MCA6066192.1 hypothetical protein [Chryseobacterium tagetis]
MENKILKKYIFLLCLFFSSSFFSQNESINMIILIDGEINKSIYDFTISDSKITEKKILGEYVPGNLNFEMQDYSGFIKNSTDNYKISFNTILTINKNLVSKKSYNMEIPKFFLNQNYIIINIFNKDSKIYKKRYSGVNKNNKEYYIVIETPSSMKFD